MKLAPLLLLLAACACAPRATPDGASAAGAASQHTVFAVRYATLPQYPVRSLVVGADPARRLDLAMMVWVIRGVPGSTVLVDAGFYREKFITQRRPGRLVSPSQAPARLGARPEDVTDVIVTHVHWDHADGVDLFPNARVWIQREEYEHHVGPDGQVLASAVDALDAEMLARLEAAGRVTLVDGDAREILPGITVHTGGKHTWESQHVSVRTARGTVVLASDNAYLYENLELRRPIAQTLDSLSNLAAQRRMLEMASEPRLVVPGHDALVFERFPGRGRVAEIR